MAILKLLLRTVRFLSFLSDFGDDMAWGEPGEDSTGEPEVTDAWLQLADVGVIALEDEFTERMDSERTENLLSSEVVTGTLKRTLE